MAPLSIVAGTLLVLCAVILLLPWLRTIPNLGALPALPWQAGAGALLVIVMIAALYRWSGTASRDAEPRTAAASKAPAQTIAPKEDTTATWSDIANNMGAANGSMSAQSARKAGAEPMEAAVASLQRRLAKGGGSADDWELLAKSYEFLGRPADANLARSHQLPASPGADLQPKAIGAEKVTR